MAIPAGFGRRDRTRLTGRLTRLEFRLASPPLQPLAFTNPDVSTIDVVTNASNSLWISYSLRDCFPGNSHDIPLSSRIAVRAGAWGTAAGCRGTGERGISIRNREQGRPQGPGSVARRLPRSAAGHDRGPLSSITRPDLPERRERQFARGFDAMLERLRAEALGPEGAHTVTLDDEAFDPAGYLSASARTIAMEPDGRFSPAGRVRRRARGRRRRDAGRQGRQFQLRNPGRWQARRDSDRDKMAAFVRGLGAGDA